MTQNTEIQDYVKANRRCKAFGLREMGTWDFDHDNGENPAATDVAKRYTEKFPVMQKFGSRVFLFGGPRAGKSFMAAEIVNELTDRGYKCRFTSLLNISCEWSNLPPGSRSAFMDALFENQLLVLDDFGTEPATNINLQLLEQIINTCQNKRIPLIITTPFTEDALMKESKGKWHTAIKRLLADSVPFTVIMPAARRYRMLQQKREMNATLLAGACPQQPDMFTEPGTEESAQAGADTETAILDCLPENIQQTLPFDAQRECDEKNDKE